MSWFKGILCGWVCFTSVAGAAGTRLCVVDFQTRAHPISKELTKIFGQRPDAKLFIEAQPSDLVECLSGDYEEVILVGHTGIMDETQEHINLTYFEELTGSDRAEFLASEKIRAQTALARFEEKLRWERAQRSRERGNYFPKEMRLSYQIGKIEKFLNAIETLPLDQPFYGPAIPLTNRVFRRAEENLVAKLSSSQVRLKRLRIMVCDAAGIVDRYEFLARLRDEFGVELDLAPPSPIMSWLKQFPVTAFNRRWFEKSLHDSSQQGGK